MPTFPFPTLRAGQEQLIQDIEGVVAQGGVLLCSAPTGIGKTAAALWPMLVSAVTEERQVFFVTAKRSQQELALETLARMLEPAARPGAVQIATRQRFCPLDGRQCAEPVCARRRATTRDTADELAFASGAAPSGVAHAESVADIALEHGLCPFELSLIWAERAHAIVGDFNYVFDPRSRLRRFFDGPYDRQLLIVDEAHNLPDRVAAYDSPVLDLAQLRRVARRCAELGDEPFLGAARLLDEVDRRAERVRQSLEDERPGPPPWVGRLAPALLDDLEPALGALDEAYTTFLAERPGVTSLLATPALGARTEGLPRDPLLEQLSTLRHLARLSREGEERFAGIFEVEAIRALSLEPGERIRERVLGFHATVCMSATLTPFEFHQRRLGLEGPSVLTVALPSPFPRHHRRLLCVPTVDTRREARDADAPSIAAVIAGAIRVRPGNYLAFFPSYAYRDRVVSAWSRAEQSRLGVLLQLPGLPAEALLARLRSNTSGTRLLCAVHGGVLSEGVDYPGDLAVGVFVVGPALPTVSLEREVLRAHYDAPGGALPPSGDPGADTAHEPGDRTAQSGFDLAYVHPGIQRVVQAGGRVIRTPTDRAFIVLIGQRFAVPRYREKLPPDWRADLEDTEDAVPLIEQFWRRPADVPVARRRPVGGRIEELPGPRDAGAARPPGSPGPPPRTPIARGRQPTRALQRPHGPPRSES